MTETGTLALNRVSYRSRTGRSAIASGMSGWSIADIADALASSLRDEDSRLRAEQAVYGLDALDEVRLHPVIARGLREAGYGVHREIRYPADRNRLRESEGERCDFVLTQDGRDLREPDRKRTLFDSPSAVDVEDAFWLEIKVAWQYVMEGPNPRYTAQMLTVARGDVAKLSKDRSILHAGLAMIAFVENEEIAHHDLRVWYERYVSRGFPVGYPSTRLPPISNRLGNGVAAIALCPINHL